jgi:hypothetical protein
MDGRSPSPIPARRSRRPGPRKPNKGTHDVHDPPHHSCRSDRPGRRLGHDDHDDSRRLRRHRGRKLRRLGGGRLLARADPHPAVGHRVGDEQLPDLPDERDRGDLRTLDCNSILTTTTGVKTYRWNDGTTSRFEYSRTGTRVLSQTVVTFTGTITAGKFAGSSAVETNVGVSLGVLDCLAPGGVTHVDFTALVEIL